MLCFRRAVREDPRAPDARFHLGEVLWNLGRLPDAIAVWREAAEIAPRAIPSHHALAESLLGTGDAAGAKASADALLRLTPLDARAITLAAAAAFCDARDAFNADLVAKAIRDDEGALGVTAIAGALAQTIDLGVPTPVAATVLDAIAGTSPDAARVAAMPATVLALVAERLAAPEAYDPDRFAAWIERMGARPWTAAEHDSVRRIAFAIRRFAPTHAATLAAQYATLCARVARDSHAGPLRWPRRTPGARLRIVAVAAPVPDVAAQAFFEAVAALPRSQFDVVLATTASDDEAKGIDPTGAFARLALPAVAGVVDARRVAALDADVILDTAGLEMGTGVLLAFAPARSVITASTLPLPYSMPLIDAVVEDAASLVDLLQRLQDALPVRVDGVDAATIGARWSAAVEAHRNGDRASARAGYAEVLAAQPSFAPALYLAGVVEQEEGELDAARTQFGAAVASAPDYVDAHASAIRAAIDAHDTAALPLLAAQAIAAMEDPPPALLRALGSASLALHDPDRAANLFQSALTRDPIDGETHYNHGVALQMSGAFADAARAYQRALAFRPDLVAADFNLGVIFTEQGNRNAAIAAFSQVLRRAPRHAAAYKHLGTELLAAGRIDEWEANFRQFEKHCPDALALAVHALEVCQWTGDFERLERYLDGLRTEKFTTPDSHDLVDALEELQYLLLFFDVEPSLAHRFAQTYDTAARIVYGESLPRAQGRRPGRIRVGYLSADLRNHVMGKMMWQAIRHHDRSRFALHFYALSRERDPWTQEFESVSDRFEQVAGMSERAIAERITADDLDILVDLSTHTKGARPGVMALKPARVEITHVASAGALGLSAVDFKLTDLFADIPENQSAQLEALLAMEGCVYPYRHVAVPSGARLTRAAVGIAPDATVIGAFVTGLKLSRRCLTLWREILERVPHAVLALSPVDPALRPLYVRLAASAGIAAARLAFIPQGGDDATNQLRYTLVDFVLDPMPYGGVNGTLEALDMGVPVVTLVGRRHAERTSYSILENLGVRQTIAQSGREYVAIAERLARDADFMRHVRAAIRAALVDSPLTDMPAHTRHLEAAYVAALRDRAPDALEDAERAR